MKVCSVKGSKFQETEVKADKMYMVKNYNTEIAKNVQKYGNVQKK